MADAVSHHLNHHFYRSTIIILYVGFLNANNDIAHICCLLILVMTDGPITTLLERKKIQGFSRLVCKILGFQGLELRPTTVPDYKPNVYLPQCVIISPRVLLPPPVCYYLPQCYLLHPPPQCVITPPPQCYSSPRVLLLSPVCYHTLHPSVLLPPQVLRPPPVCYYLTAVLLPPSVCYYLPPVCYYLPPVCCYNSRGRERGKIPSSCVSSVAAWVWALASRL